MVLRALAVVVLMASVIASAAMAEDFIVNPGFEEHVGDTPHQWDAYIGAGEPDGGGGGAVAALDHRAYEGDACVRLHTPIPYERDPANNWSQNILADLAGRTVTLSAMVRLEDATEAVVWLQCWRKQPWGVLKVARTNARKPLHGTLDWTPVEMQVDVPKGTDFLTVRCVLKGAGTAWFDEVHLTADAQPAASTEEKPRPVKAPAAKTEAAAPASTAPRVTMEAETASEPEGESFEGEGDWEGEDAAMRDAALSTAMELERLQEELRRMSEMNDQLENALSGASEENELLLYDMLMLQESLEEMEDRQRALLRPFIGDGEFAPPLVPRGEDWRRLR